MVSVIIPTFNEEKNIGPLVRYLLGNAGSEFLCEVIVVDADSSDHTVEAAIEAGAKVMISRKKGRAAQMNAGAAVAQGEAVYFLHADTYPPQGFCHDIITALRQNYQCGGYRLQFDYPHWFLRLNAWFTRFNISAFRFGDQSLFIKKELFEKIRGFREDLVVLEDQEIIIRLRRESMFKIFPRSVITSARKYLENGVYRTQMIFFLIYLLYQFGLPQHQLVKIYRNQLKQDKV